MRLQGEEHTGQAADAQEDPTVCGQWLVRCKTSAGCSGPIAVSSLAALVEELHKAQVDLQVWECHRMVVVAGNLDLEEDLGVDIPGVGILDPEEDPEAGNHGPGAGSLDLGAGRLVHFVRSSHRRVRDHRDQHHLGHHENLLKLVLCLVLAV